MCSPPAWNILPCPSLPSAYLTPPHPSQRPPGSTKEAGVPPLGPRLCSTFRSGSISARCDLCTPCLALGPALQDLGGCCLPSSEPQWEHQIGVGSVWPFPLTQEPQPGAPPPLTEKKLLVPNFVTCFYTQDSSSPIFFVLKPFFRINASHSPKHLIN